MEGFITLYKKAFIINTASFSSERLQLIKYGDYTHIKMIKQKIKYKMSCEQRFGILFEFTFLQVKVLQMQITFSLMQNYKPTFIYASKYSTYANQISTYARQFCEKSLLLICISGKFVCNYGRAVKGVAVFKI